MSTSSNITEAFQKIVSQMNDIQKRQLPNILAEKATAYFKGSFKRKSWDDIPWQPAKKPPKRGSLMDRSGNLANSIQPKTVTSERVVISAGNSKVPYAKIHNEGGTIRHPGGERKLAFKKYSRGKLAGKTLFAKNNLKASFGQKVNVNGYSITVPRRQFMGDSPLLRKQLLKDIETAFKPITK